jgi:hypothetical protein
LLFLELGFILYVLFMLKFNFPQTIDTTKLSFLRLRLQHVSQQTQGLVTIIFTKKPQGRNLKCQISIQHFFKIVLYWCLDLIRHNIGTHLKLNKYIFDISIPFCHHLYLSATLKQCFTEFAVCRATFHHVDMSVRGRISTVHGHKYSSPSILYNMYYIFHIKPHFKKKTF